jgi:hypothetical protein
MVLGRINSASVFSGRAGDMHTRARSFPVPSGAAFILARL